MAGDAETGVSIMRVTAGLDSGPVALGGASRSAPTTPTARSRRASRRSAPTCSSARSTSARPTPSRTRRGVTYAEKITAADRTLDPAAPAEARARVVRALRAAHRRPRRAADGSFLGVRAARVGADGELELVEVQPPGGRPMAYADYVRGHGAR